MPTVAFRGRRLVVTRRRPTRFNRDVADGPPGALLSPGGPLAPQPSSPARALAVDALAILRLARGAGQLPAIWSTVRFGREVELVRAHLRPIRTRAALSASFGHEAFHMAPEAGEAARSPGPVRVAYAIRWLELGDGGRREPWPLCLETALV
jgi:hypothetical protein